MIADSLSVDPVFLNKFVVDAPVSLFAERKSQNLSKLSQIPPEDRQAPVCSQGPSYDGDDPAGPI